MEMKPSQKFAKGTEITIDGKRYLITNEPRCFQADDGLTHVLAVVEINNMTAPELKEYTKEAQAIKAQVEGNTNDQATV